MLTLDGVPLRCPNLKCLSENLRAVGHELEQRLNLDYLRCDDCGNERLLWTLIDDQATLPKRSHSPKARTTDPLSSQQAAQFDFAKQTATVLDALIAIGPTHAGAIKRWLAERDIDIERSVIARRLDDLLEAGAAYKCGFTKNDKGANVLQWAPTEQARRRAA